MGRVENKVAFITGAARGQGRSHAIRLAQEGADIIAIDIASDVATVQYPGATKEDLAETVRLVEALDRRIVAVQADVRDFDALKSVLDQGVAELGRLDIVVANAGIFGQGRADELSGEAWSAMIDINLTGVWQSAKAAIPHLKSGGRGGAIILTSSGAAIKANENMVHYSAAKHGVVGVMKSLALELAGDGIRVNSVLPGMVDTGMVQNDAMYRLFRPDLANPKADDFEAAARSLSAIPVPWIEPIDVSNAILWLASDEARYVTGVALPIDAGTLLK